VRIGFHLTPLSGPATPNATELVDEFGVRLERAVER
jgi:hypothetical protein